MLTNVKGFTLMEILVVVTIIGILAAIAVPSYIYAVDRGRQEACATNVQILITQVERYRLVEGKDIDQKGKSLVDFLKDEGYLAGQEIRCPFSSHDSEGTKYEYILEMDMKRQTVRCTHNKTDDQGQ